MSCFGSNEKATEEHETLIHEKSSSVTTDLSQWMTHLQERLTKIPINQLAIPGSHDSGAYYLDPNTPICPDEPDIIKDLGPCLKSVIVNWGLTQEDPIVGQLQNGIRYFDMRPGYLDSDDDFLFVHGVYGHPILGMLNDIRSFLKANPKEVVIVDFNHFYSFTSALHDRFVKGILAALDGMIYTSDHPKGVTISLADLWKIKKQIIIRYTEKTVCDKHKEFWPTAIISNPWFNTDSVSTLISKLNGNFANLQASKFNVFQAILTPQTATIALHLTSSLRKCLVDKCDPAVIKWLNDIYTQRKKGVNIVICDFACVEGCIPAILQLNEINAREKS